MSVITDERKTVTVTEDELFDLRMDAEAGELQTECYGRLVSELRKVIPERLFRRILLETVASFYRDYDEFDAENIAHRMQKDFGFRMHEVDDIRNAMTDAADCLF
ncbi:MAG: hypothetical protein ACI4NM_04825 [Bullifex sp.]